MPAQKDLTGQRFGRLTVLRKEGRVTYGGKPQAAWRVRCDCGREEVYPQNRLPHTSSIARSSRAVTACSHCSAPPCVVCGEPVLVGSRSNTCSESCYRQHRRAQWRDSYKIPAAQVRFVLSEHGIRPIPEQRRLRLSGLTRRKKKPTSRARIYFDGNGWLRIGRCIVRRGDEPVTKEQIIAALDAQENHNG